MEDVGRNEIRYFHHFTTTSTTIATDTAASTVTATTIKTKAITTTVATVVTDATTTAIKVKGIRAKWNAETFSNKTSDTICIHVV